jgi:sterol desaturase/sphingolipid hydroxylase (fatty acid hydroxylase superfamily)
MGMGESHKDHSHVAPSERPVVFPLIEAGALVSFAAIQLTGWRNIGTKDLIGEAPLLSHSLSLFLAVLSWMLADFFSGLAHYFADNYGTEDTPLVGRTLIGPFREHHHAPRAMLQHGFLERNGNSALIALPTICWIPFFPLNAFFRALAMVLLMMTMWVVLTNQIHAWSHQDVPPRLVRLLQTCGVLLSPEHHAVHHAPFERQRALLAGSSVPELAPNVEEGANYCITSGVCDRVMALFSRAERAPEPLPSAQITPSPGHSQARD